MLAEQAVPVSFFGQETRANIPTPVRRRYFDIDVRAVADPGLCESYHGSFERDEK